MNALNALALAIGIIVLGACNSVAPPSPKSEIAGLQAALTTADQAAIAYVKLPTCLQPKAPAVCSNPVVVDQIATASKAAFVAVTAAHDVVYTAASTQTDMAKALASANTALDAFKSLISILPKGQ